MRTILMLLFLGIILKACQNPSPKESISESAENNELILGLQQLQKTLQVPMVGLGIIRNGEISYCGVIGMDGMQKSPETLFNVASITKVVFGTTVMKLVDEGIWDLNEPLFPYWIDPDLIDDPRHKMITSRHILSQQSGFVNWRWNHPTGKLTFDNDPGTVFNYSGEGMEYLRKAIENKMDESWEIIADSFLFSKIGMNNTAHAWDGKENFDQFSGFYDTEGNRYKIEDHSFEAQAADDLMTTIEDLTLFGKYIIDGAGMKPATFSKMASAHTSITDNQKQALSWRLIDSITATSDYALHHGGNDIGVATLIMLVPEKKEGIVVLTNGDNGILICNEMARQVLNDGEKLIHRAYKSGPISDVPDPIQVNPMHLHSLQGTYVQPSEREVDIYIDNQKLWMKMPGVPNFQLLPMTKDTFFVQDFDPRIVFTSKNSKPVLIIIEGENRIVCPKNE